MSCSVDKSKSALERKEHFSCKKTVSGGNGWTTCHSIDAKACFAKEFPRLVLLSAEVSGLKCVGSDSSSGSDGQ